MKIKDKEKDNVSKRLEKMLLRKALGYKSSEIVEEYIMDKDGGSLTLSKRKVTYKQVPPDVSATKVLLEIGPENGSALSEMTDSQLEEEKQRLLKLLNRFEEKEEEENNGSDTM